MGLDPSRSARSPDDYRNRRRWQERFQAVPPSHNLDLLIEPPELGRPSELLCSPLYPLRCPIDRGIHRLPRFSVDQSRPVVASYSMPVMNRTGIMERVVRGWRRDVSG